MATRKQKRVPHDNNELFKRAINLLSDAVLLLDRQSKIIFVNSTTPSLLGVPRQGLLGKPLDKVLTLEDPITRRRMSAIPSTANGPIFLLATVGDTLFNATIRYSSDCGLQQTKVEGLDRTISSDLGSSLHLLPIFTSTS